MKKDEVIIQSILQAAKHLIQQYGLAKTSMEDIARAAGKGKSTLYYYFKNKDQIFEKVIHGEMDEFFQVLHQEVNQQKDAIEMLRAYIITKIKTLKSKVNLYRLTLETDIPSAFELNKKMTALRARYDEEDKELVHFILKEGIKTGTFRHDLLEDSSLLSDLFVTCFRGVEMNVITSERYQFIEEKIDLLIRIMIQGIGK